MVDPETAFVTPGEGRLRTPWRLLVWLVAVLVAGALGGALRIGLATVAPGGVLAALLAVAGALAIYAVVTGATVLVAWAVDRRSAAGLGLGGRAFRRSLAVGLALGLAMTAVVFLTQVAAGFARVVGVLVLDPSAGVVPGASVNAAALAGVGPLALLALLVPFFVAVGIAEEVLLRGYLLTNVAEGLAGLGPITERAATWLAILATGALFGALHAANPAASVRSAAAITAVGVVLGWTYAVTGDLGVPIGIHVTWNLGLAAVWGFPVSGLAVPASLLATEVSGPALVTGGAFGPEAGLVMVVPLALAVLATAWWADLTTGRVAVDPELARFVPGDR